MQTPELPKRLGAASPSPGTAAPGAAPMRPLTLRERTRHPAQGAGEAALQSPVGRFAASLNINVNRKAGAPLWTSHLQKKTPKILVKPLLLWVSRDLPSAHGSPRKEPSRLRARRHQVEQHFG